MNTTNFKRGDIVDVALAGGGTIEAQIEDLRFANSTGVRFVNGNLKWVYNDQLRERRAPISRGWKNLETGEPL